MSDDRPRSRENTKRGNQAVIRPSITLPRHSKNNHFALSLSTMFVRFSVLTTLFAAVVSASNVLELTPDNFDEVVGKGKPALVELYVASFTLAMTCGSFYMIASPRGGMFCVVPSPVDADDLFSLTLKWTLQGMSSYSVHSAGQLLTKVR